MKQQPKAGRGAPTSRDVAALAGVAQSTVSHVINGRSVAPETRRRVEEAMRELRYQPNAGARTLRTSRTNVIALVVRLGRRDDPVETVPYIDAVVDLARRRDYDIILSTLPEGSESIVRLARRAICDGFVVMDVEAHDPRVATLAGLAAPAVLVGRPADAQGLDVVDLDMARTAEMLVDELAATGHRRIAMLGDASADAHAFRYLADFHEGVRRRAREHRIELDVIAPAESGWSGVAAAGSRILGRPGDRVGLLAGTSRTTQWFMNLLQLYGLVPGRDVSVVSRCPDDVACSFAYPVTNVSPRPAELTRVAMEYLFERLAGGDGAGRVTLVEPASPVRRATTAVFT